MMQALRRLLRKALPGSVRRSVVRYSRWPPIGRADLGDMRRLTPISREWGADRGQPIDRYYIERFLGDNASQIRGHVLEIGYDRYTRSFGGDRVTHSDVLHVAERNPGVTIVADLTRADNIASDTFDCMILTQTLQFVQDVPAVLNTVHRILKPGGVLLATFPGISQISRYDMDRWGHFWSFTTRSAKTLFEEVFPADEVSIEAKGNVLAASAFLYGLAAEELAADELESFDPEYEVLITVVARKPETAE